MRSRQVSPIRGRFDSDRECGARVSAQVGLSDAKVAGRARPWPSRLYAIVSSISIALVGAVALSLLAGEPFARAWSAASSTFAVAAVAIWHGGIARGYAAMSRAVIPARRAIVVGANEAGRLSAGALADQGYDVVGYADNGTDLLDAIDRPLLGPIARLEDLVQSFGVDEVLIALPTDRREQIDQVLTKGFSRHVRVKYAADPGELLPRRFELCRIGATHYFDFTPVARVNWFKRALDLTSAELGPPAPL